jgi:DNA-binding transcriptional ArsR family regulator
MRAWIRLPLDALIASRGVTQSAVVVLAQICDRAAKACTTTGIEVTADELAAEGGKSRRTVCRALAELQRLELIAARRTGRGSVYELRPGCVELYPDGTFDGTARAGTSRQNKQNKQMLVSEQAQMQEYLSLVNRFDDEPLPGQQEFEEV